MRLGRPLKYSHTDDLPAGSWLLVPLDDGQFTIARIVGLKRWLPLSSWADPGLLTWPTWCDAKAFADQEGAPLLDWPHWGLCA